LQRRETLGAWRAAQLQLADGKAQGLAAAVLEATGFVGAAGPGTVPFIVQPGDRAVDEGACLYLEPRGGRGRAVKTPRQHQCQRQAAEQQGRPAGHVFSVMHGNSSVDSQSANTLEISVLTLASVSISTKRWARASYSGNSSSPGMLGSPVLAKLVHMVIMRSMTRSSVSSKPAEVKMSSVSPWEPVMPLPFRSPICTERPVAGSSTRPSW